MRVILENIHEYNHCVLFHFNKIRLLEFAKFGEELLW